MLTLDVPGEPAGKGSWRVGRQGQFLPQSTKTTRQAERITAMTVRDWMPRDPLTGPVAVRVMVTVERPAYQFWPVARKRPQRVLRDDAPTWPVGTPDLDKVQRLIGDALAVRSGGVVIRDDNQVVAWDARRQYGLKPATHIEVFDLTTPTEGNQP